MELDKKEIETLINDKMKSYVIRFGNDFKLAVIEVLSLEKMLAPEVKPAEEEKIIPLADWNDYYNYPSVGSLRQAYFRRETNGFDYCVEYGGENGGRILINVNKFKEWQKKRNKQRRTIVQE